MGRVDLGAMRRRGADLFSGFTSGQKAMLVLAGIGTFLGGMVFLRMSGHQELVPLYSNLPTADAAEVVQSLDGQGTTYELADGGSTILVPRSDVYSTRLALSAEGLPRDGAPGYDLLDAQGITTSEFRQRVDYQRALEGELSRTIGAIDGVESSIVHLVMPEDDLFSGDAQHPSASVLIETRSGATLAPGQVQAVVHLVASSVEGLQADQVTVADSAGRVLSAPGEDGMAAAAGDLRSSQTAGFESALASRLEAMLAEVTGPDRARVTVSAELDFDRRQTTTESFGDPGTAPVVAESTSSETYTGTGDAVGGVLGPDALPTETAGGDTDSNYSRDAVNRTFANDKVTEVIEFAPGTVQRLSIAVLVDQDAGIDARAVEDLVRAGAGIVVERGDTVEVTQLPFDTSAATAAQERLDAARASEERTQLFSLLRTVASVLIVAVILFFAWRSTRRAAVARYPMAIPLDVADPDDRGLPAGPATSTADHPDELDMTDEPLPLPGPTAADLQREEMQDQITDLIDRQPDDVAQVLRTWMAERR